VSLLRSNCISLSWITVPILGNFLFTTASRTALEPTQPPIQWVPESLSLGVKRPGREADHSPPSSAEVKNAWSYTSTPQHVFMAWCLVKHRDFTLTVPITEASERGACLFMAVQYPTRYNKVASFLVSFMNPRFYSP
jgi:hypothetical protein